MSKETFLPFHDLSGTCPEFNGVHINIPSITLLRAKLSTLETELNRLNEVFNTQFSDYCVRSTRPQAFEFCTYRVISYLDKEILSNRQEVCYVYWRAKRGSRRTVKFKDVIERAKSNGASIEVLNTYIGIELQRIELFSRIKPIVNEIRYLIEVINERQEMPVLPLMPEFIEFVER